MEQQPKLKCGQCYTERKNGNWKDKNRGTRKKIEQEILEIIKETREKWGMKSYEKEKQELEERKRQEEDFLRWKKEKLQRIYNDELEEDTKIEREENEREWEKQRK